MSNYIIFSINQQIMAVPVNYVEKIMNFTVITKIPTSQNYIEGVISYQDEIIPAINLGKLLNLDYAEKDGTDVQIIILNFNEKKAGIIVDEVREIENVEENVPYLEIKSQYVTGTMKLKDDMVNIINPEIVNSVEPR